MFPILYCSLNMKLFIRFSVSSDGLLLQSVYG
jgi:hypothetical protein